MCSSTAQTISLDCGVDDYLIEHSRSFHAHLDKLGVQHSYSEHPGSHNWVYWNEHILDLLESLSKKWDLPEFNPEDHPES